MDQPAGRVALEHRIIAPDLVTKGHLSNRQGFEMA